MKMTAERFAKYIDHTLLKPQASEEMIEKLCEEMKALGIRIVSPIVSAVDRTGEIGIRIDKESLQRCRELGRTVAIESCKSWRL